MERVVPSPIAMGVRRFEELICWQLARELAGHVNGIIHRPAAQRDLRFCSELSDATSSISRNIAEGFARRSRGEFARFLDFSLGSAAETQVLLDDALGRGYVSVEEHQKLKLLAIRIAITTRRLAACQREFARESRKRRR